MAPVRVSHYNDEKNVLRNGSTAYAFASRVNDSRGVCGVTD